MIPAKLLLLLGAAAIASCSSDATRRAAGERSYVNPVLDRDFPDPAVLAADGWYYAYATQTSSDGRMLNIQSARSRDLVQWEPLGDALPVKPSWAASKQNFWAPHVIHDGERRTYVMYYSAEPDAAAGKCLAVATSADPRGPFVDSGDPMHCGEGVEHIDPMAFDDPQTGKRLLYWGSSSRPIKVQELARDRLRFLEDSRPENVIFPDHSREYRKLIEGAWVIYRSGIYFMFYSGERCCGRQASYAVMVARSSTAFGPFEHFPGPGGNSVILRESAQWRAPGHNSVIADAQGNDWMLYHAYSAADGDRADRRVMLLDRIVYRDGWPRVSGDEPSAGRRSAPAVADR